MPACLNLIKHTNFGNRKYPPFLDLFSEGSPEQKNTSQNVFPTTNAAKSARAM
jgi:hypothetical protein